MNDTLLMLRLLFYAIDDYVEEWATEGYKKTVQKACERTGVQYSADRDKMIVQTVERMNEVIKEKADGPVTMNGLAWTAEKGALKVCMDELCRMCRDEAHERGDASPCVNECETIRIAKAALFKPARNCDMLDADGLLSAFDKYCESKPECRTIPCLKCFKCAFQFALAEYGKAGA